jgi:hypothetical protein
LGVRGRDRGLFLGEPRPQRRGRGICPFGLTFDLDFGLTFGHDHVFQRQPLVSIPIDLEHATDR